MILPDFEICKLVVGGEMIKPFDKKRINPASYDVRIGPDVIREGKGFTETVMTGRIVLEPGEFILAHTMETFNLPDDICAQFSLKSTIARLGLEHSMAGFCDPGWHGSVLTMELKNNLKKSRIIIPVGTPIGQMVFMRMENPPDKSYAKTGHYNKNRTVQGPRKTKVKVEEI